LFWGLSEAFLENWFRLCEGKMPPSQTATPIERLENGGYEDVLKNLAEGIAVLLIDFLKLFDAAKRVIYPKHTRYVFHLNQ
jgi:hypothetical protein